MKQNGESELCSFYMKYKSRPRIPKTALKMLNIYARYIRVFRGFTVSIGIVDGRLGVGEVKV